MKNQNVLKEWISGEKIFCAQYSEKDLDVFKQYKNRPGLI
jgi:hypothetical protein